MIHSQDRSGYFGASDTAVIMGNWTTKTFERFWMEKLGLLKRDFANTAMRAGTEYEHRILDYLGIVQRDRQIIIEDLKLRVNLDGETEIIHEVKTHKKPVFVVTKPYWQQSQVEMFAAGKNLEIVSYQMTESEYKNFFLPIDGRRIGKHQVAYDQQWIECEYRPRLVVLVDCLRQGVWPRGDYVSGCKSKKRRRSVAVPTGG